MGQFEATPESGAESTFDRLNRQVLTGMLTSSDEPPSTLEAP
jgi:hypothetical protein